MPVINYRARCIAQSYSNLVMTWKKKACTAKQSKKRKKDKWKRLKRGWRKQEVGAERWHCGCCVSLWQLINHIHMAIFLWCHTHGGYSANAGIMPYCCVSGCKSYKGNLTNCYQFTTSSCFCWNSPCLLFWSIMIMFGGFLHVYETWGSGIRLAMTTKAFSCIPPAVVW